MQEKKPRDPFTALALELKQGKQSAAEKIFDHFSPQIFRFFLVRLGHRENAEDLTQEVFVKVVRHIQSFNEESGDFSPWFWQIARNSLIDHFREKKVSYIDDLFNEGQDIPSLKNNIGDKIMLREVMEEVENFSPEEQEIFSLHYLSDVDYKELSRVTGKSEGALRVIVHRMQKKIKDIFHNA